MHGPVVAERLRTFLPRLRCRFPAIDTASPRRAVLEAVGAS
jgi:hypothetical protein